jgi:post-segregation antitoxin (ccd killing protein)
MTVTIQLPSDIEAELIAQARAQGLDLSEYVEHVLREQVPSRGASSALSPAERADAWRESTRGLPHTPPLSDDAISRESIYGDRGR